MSWDFVLLWSMVSVLVGLVAFHLDRWLGRRLYRIWYNLTHKDPLPKNIEHGLLIYRRRSQFWLAGAVLLSLIVSLISMRSDVADLQKFLMFFIQLPVIVIGFAVGPWTYRLWKRRDPAFQAADRIIQGDVNVPQEIQKAAGRMHHEAASHTSKLLNRISNLFPSKRKKITIEQSPQEEMSLEEAEAIIQSYIKGEELDHE